MINVVCKSLKELQNAIQDKIDYALLTDVADTVSDVMTDHITKDVYDKYNPHMYQRRFNQSGNDIDSLFDDTDNVGLLNPENIISSIENSNILTVENVTVGSKYYFYGGERRISQNAGDLISGVIETGDGYDIHGWVYDGMPRPFIQNTREDLKNNKYHVIALKQGLKKQGLEVK